MTTAGQTEHNAATLGSETRTERGQADADGTRTGKPLPRGYRIREMKDGRKEPFLLLVRQRLHSKHETHAKALAAARELLDKEREFGREVRAFDPREWRRYLDAKARYFGGKEPDWALLAAKNQLRAKLTVADAVAKYLTARATDGLAAGTMRQIKKKLARLTQSLGDRDMRSITPDDVRAWLAELSGFAAWTRRDHYKVARTFWQHARRERWIDDNPWESAKAPKAEADEVNILTLDEARRLFAANRNQPVVGRLALEAFGGLRNSSAGRTVKDDVKFDRLGIELPGRKHKSGRRHYIDGLPANLWAWLRKAPKHCWEMSEREYLDAKAEAFRRAKVVSTHNCLRHSFCTYHVAMNKDAAKTAVLMQHTSPRTLYRHYYGRATQADGAAYFAIVP